MLMKWEDLEPGDKVKIHPEVLKYWRRLGVFLNKKLEKNFIVSRVNRCENLDIIYITLPALLSEIGTISIDINTGFEVGHNVSYPFFEVVKLRKD